MQKRKTSELKIAGIGEILWDVIGESEELGGAPVNFAYHAGALGANGYAISTVGDDRRGKLALAELQKRGVTTDYITKLPGATTGYVLARVDDEGVASYKFPDDVAWDHIQVSRESLALARKLDCICFGSLAQRSEASGAAIMDYLEKVGPDTLKVFDMNLRQTFYSEGIIRRSLERADVVKLNDEEIVRLAELEGLRGNQQAQLQSLVDRYELRLAVLTRGGEGSLLVSPGSVSDHRGYKAAIVDTIGAGDSFTAATVLGLLHDHFLDDINDHANRVAAFVCSQKGAMPNVPEEYRFTS